MKSEMKCSIRQINLFLCGLLISGAVIAQTRPQQPRRLPEGCAPAPGTAMDAATGLPKRIVHQASGVVLVLIPAGEFVMGSPNNEANRLRGEDRHRRVIRRPFYI